MTVQVLRRYERVQVDEQRTTILLRHDVTVHERRVVEKAQMSVGPPGPPGPAGPISLATLEKFSNT